MIVNGGTSGQGRPITGVKYDPYTGTEQFIYGPKPKAKAKATATKKATPKKAPTSSQGSKAGSSGNKKASTSKATPPKKVSTKGPSKPSVGNGHKGSGESTEKEVKEAIREIEYDLEGSVMVHPNPDFSSKIEARQQVNLRGLGNNFSGNYFVGSVTHTINRSGYQLALELLRKEFVWKPDPAQAKPKTEPKKESSGGSTHTVKKGESLWAIAKRVYGNGAEFTRIVNANKGKIKDPDKIYPGQVLTIPPK